MTVALDPNPACTARIVASFVRSVMEVFLTMVHVQVKVGKPFLKKDPLPTYDVSGVIGLSGKYSGSMVLSLQEATAAALVAAFAGMPIPVKSPDFPDAIGELANMIAGNAKTSFGEGTSISTPSIIMGVGHTVARLHDVPCIIIPCTTDHGAFALEINLKPPPAGVPSEGGAA